MKSSSRRPYGLAKAVAALHPVRVVRTPQLPGFAAVLILGIGVGFPLTLPADAAYRLAPIVVTIGRIAEVEDQTVAPVGVVERREIERRQAQDLDAVLLGMPGVTTAGGPRQAALDPNIRGLGEGRVVVRIDGARQNLNIRHRGQTFIDPALFERVEVLRGPGSSLHGSGAIGGVMSLRTLEPSSVLEPGQDLGGRVVAGYQDNGRRVSGGLTLAGRGAATEWLGAVSLRDHSDFRDGEGERVAFTGSDVVSGLLKGRWDIDQGHPWRSLGVGWRLAVARP